MKWIKLGPEENWPTFDTYSKILVLLKCHHEPQVAARDPYSGGLTNPCKDGYVCCNPVFVCEHYNGYDYLSYNCINHSLECGTHSIDYKDITHWMPITYPEGFNEVD